jgi:hypothetical protein
MRARLPLFAAALWWGSLSCVGFLVVPLLFARLPTPALAGNTAAVLFSALTWVSVVCGMLLLMLARGGASQPPPPWAGRVSALVVAGLLMALLSEFAVAPRIVARDNLALWHSVGTGLYLLQWVSATLVLAALAARADSKDQAGV